MNSEVCYFTFAGSSIIFQTKNKLIILGEREGHVLIGPKKYMYPLNFVKHANQLYNFEAREDDIWVVTFARSGTTWTQELVWMIANDLDYVRAQRELLTARSPFFE